MRLVLRAAFAAAIVTILSSANPAAAAGPKPLFAADSVLHLTLKGPIGNISRIKGEKPFAAQLTVEGAAPEALPITLSVRGIMRRRKATCDFPPLRVNFDQKPADGSIFKGQKHLKLVTFCRDTDRFQQYVLLEYSAYKLYQALTPDSLKVRLVQVDYIREDGRPLASRTGFFIEDISDLAKRSGHERLRNVKSITVSQLNATSSARFAVFQYMISNMDWSMLANAPPDDCCHNSRLLTAKGATTDLIVVPYDFDYAGLVNAPYAVPPAGYKESSVLTRRYGGFCVHNDVAAGLIADMQTRRASLLGVMDQIPQMDPKTIEKAKDYLGEFFDRTATPAKVAEVQQTCLK